MNKKILLIGLIIIVVTMSIGYAIYSTSLKVTGTGNIDSNFNIEVTGIKEDKKEGKAISITEPTYTKTSATFNTKLSREKDNIEYKVEISNKGSIDGKIEKIEIINPNEQVLVETRGIEKGQILKAGETLEYIVRVCIPEGTKINEDVTSKIEVFTEIIQDDKQIFNEPIDGIEANKLSIESTIEESDYTSIKALVKAKGNGLKYSYSLDDKNYTEVTESNTYTFTGLTPNTRYTVYYKVEDKDGNYETESKWIETKYDSMPPECTLEVKEITLDNIKIKATCTDETEIVKYELSDNGGLFENKQLQTEYIINNVYLSKIKIKVTDLFGNSKEYKLNENELNEAYNELYEMLNEDYNELSSKQDQIENNFLDKTYPIGSIYAASNDENPSETIGGTWEKYGNGKMLVGVDENDSNFNVVNKTGGSSTSTLAITNIPSHMHTIPKLSGSTSSSGSHTHNNTAKSSTITGYFGSEVVGQHVNWATGAFSAMTLTNSSNQATYVTKTTHPIYGYKLNATPTITMTNVSDGAHTHNVTMNESKGNNCGDGISFTNLPSYITLHIYKRIS